MLRTRLTVTVGLMLSVLGCGARPADPAQTEPPRLPTSAPAAGSASAGSEAPTAGDRREVIGTSVQGRPIEAQTLGHGPRRVLVIAGIHGDEPEGRYSAEQLPAAFAAAHLDDAVTLTLVADANPDGRVAGTRTNANGVDVNRNFPASNFDTTDPSHGGAPLSQPEAQALHQTIERIKPDLVLSLHSWVNREFVNFDGPARPLAERFSASSGLVVEESGAFTPTPGSLGSYVGRDRGTPILTVELRRGADPQQCWARIRDALLQAIAG